MEIKISIVEDDYKIRTGIAALINGSEGCRCISSFSQCGRSCPIDIPLDKPDVILMDINLPHMSGIECVKAIKKTITDVQVIMLTVYEDSEKIFESLKAGANGYLLKRTPPAELLRAISEVYNGGSPMTSQIARKVVKYFQQKPSAEGTLKDLTQREEEILDLLSKGLMLKKSPKNFLSVPIRYIPIFILFMKSCRSDREPKPWLNS